MGNEHDNGNASIRSLTLMKHSQKSGFTLIELLVVIAIIAILAAILFPVFAQAREKARAISCLSNCKQTGLAFYMYTQDYNEMTPAINKTPDTPGLDGQPAWRPWYALLMPYVKSWTLFTCPDDGRTYPLTISKTSQSHKAGGGDVYDCWDDLNPTGLCISYGYNDGWVTDGGYGLIGPQITLAGITVRPGRSIAAIISPASTIAFGDADTKEDGSVGSDAALKWAVAYGPKPGSNNSQLESSSQLRHGGLENFVFCDGHAHIIRMYVAENSYYNLASGGNPLYIPQNQADATDWCFDPNYVSSYTGYGDPTSYPLHNNGETCAQAIADVYANSAPCTDSAPCSSLNPPSVP